MSYKSPLAFRGEFIVMSLLLTKDLSSWNGNIISASTEFI